MTGTSRKERLLGHSADFPVLRCGGVEATADVVAAWVRATSAWLGREGVRKGDRVAFLAAAGAPQLAFFLGCIHAGAIPCPLNPRQPAATIAASVDSASAAALVVFPDDPGVLASPEAPTLSFPWTRDDLLDLAAWRTSSRDSWADLQVPEDSPAAVVFTSGSAGAPRAAVLSIGNLLANARASRGNIPLGGDDAWLLSLPLYHVSGLGIVFRCLAIGATIAVPDPGEPIAGAVARLGVSHLSLVSTQMHRMLADGDGMRALQRIKAVLLGGSAIPDDLLHEVARLRLPVATSYGLTEMASQVATTALDAHHDGPRRSARVLIPGTVRLSDDGEILVSGPCLFLGYLGFGGAVHRPVDADGWFATGDLGEWAPDGGLRVLGRRDCQFVCGGENVQPEEIESALLSLPAIAKAVVVPVADPEWGERPVAFVEVRPGYGLPMESDLRDSLRERLPGLKIPRTLLPWPHDIDAGGIKPRRSAFAERARELLSPSRDGAAEHRPAD